MGFNCKMVVLLIQQHMKLVEYLQALLIISAGYGVMKLPLPNILQYKDSQLPAVCPLSVFLVSYISSNVTYLDFLQSPISPNTL